MARREYNEDLPLLEAIQKGLGERIWPTAEEYNGNDLTELLGKKPSVS